MITESPDHSDDIRATGSSPEHAALPECDEGFLELTGALRESELSDPRASTDVEPDALERALNMLEASLSEESRIYSEVQKALAARRQPQREYVIPVDPEFVASVQTMMSSGTTAEKSPPAKAPTPFPYADTISTVVAQCTAPSQNVEMMPVPDFNETSDVSANQFVQNIGETTAGENHNVSQVRPEPESPREPDEPRLASDPFDETDENEIRSQELVAPGSEVQTDHHPIQLPPDSTMPTTDLARENGEEIATGAPSDISLLDSLLNLNLDANGDKPSIDSEIHSDTDITIDSVLVVFGSGKPQDLAQWSAIAEQLQNESITTADNAIEHTRNNFVLLSQQLRDHELVPEPNTILNHHAVSPSTTTESTSFGPAPTPITEGVIQAARPLETGRELSIVDENFEHLQDQAFGAPGSKNINDSSLSINDDKFANMQDLAFGTSKSSIASHAVPSGQNQAGDEAAAGTTSSGEFERKTGEFAKATGEFERRQPRLSQEFLKIKKDEESAANAQEMSQKLRILPLPTAEEKELSPEKRLYMNVAQPYQFTKKRIALMLVLPCIIFVLAAFAKTDRTFLNQGYVTYNSGRYEEALPLFEHSLLLNKGLLEAHLCKARTYHALRKLAPAYEEYSYVLQKWPINPVALSGRAAICAETSNWAIVKADLEMLYRWTGKLTVQEWYEYAQSMANTGNFAIAAEAYVKGLQADKKNELGRQLNMGLAYSLRRTMRPHAAAIAASKVLLASAGDLDALRERAHDYVEAKEYDKAIEDLNQLTRKFPNDADLYYMWGLLYAGQHNADNAKKCFDIAVKLRPDWTASAKAQLQKMNKNIQLASLTGRPSRAYHPDVSYESSTPADEEPVIGADFNTLVKQGYDSIQKGRSKRAITMLAEAVRQKPADLTARRYLALALAQGNRPAEASAQFESVWARSGWSPGEQNYVANSYLKAKMPDRAIDAYQITLSKSPRNFEAQYGLAEAYGKAGLKTQALDVCRNALDAGLVGNDRARMTTLMCQIAKQSNIFVSQEIAEQRKRQGRPAKKDATSTGG